MRLARELLERRVVEFPQRDLPHRRVVGLRSREGLRRERPAMDRVDDRIGEEARHELRRAVEVDAVQVPATAGADAHPRADHRLDRDLDAFRRGIGDAGKRVDLDGRDVGGGRGGDRIRCAGPLPGGAAARRAVRRPLRDGVGEELLGDLPQRRVVKVALDQVDRRVVDPRGKRDHAQGAPRAGGVAARVWHPGARADLDAMHRGRGGGWNGRDGGVVRDGWFAHERRWKRRS
ncbi:MAG: hypothetical protein U0575_10360 [Phycisphaerales bacterium]